MYIAETSVGNSIIQEPIEGINRIERARWKLVCTICNSGVGETACIQCAKSQCYTAYHVTCARKLKLLMPMKGAEGEKLQLSSYCSKHLPEEHYQAHLEAVEEEERREEEENQLEPDSPNRSGGGGLDTPRSKSARAYSKIYSLGAPLVPAKIVNTVVGYTNKIWIRGRVPFIQMVCRYWSLKREARRGAPLLKRLHLEPWSGSGSKSKLTDEEKKTKLKYILAVRKDLEAVRLIAEVARKREEKKVKQSQEIEALLSDLLWPHENALRLAFESITARDIHDVFKNPVSKQEVPDYHDIVQKPMCWNQIDTKLDKHGYWDTEDLKTDIFLVADNAMLYNEKGTSIYKLAERIKKATDRYFSEMAALRTVPVGEGSGTLPLEPPLELIEILLGISEGKELNETSAPIDKLLTFDLEEAEEDIDSTETSEEKRSSKGKKGKGTSSKKPKEKTSAKKDKPPRDYAAERARKKARLEKEAQAVAETAPTYLPRTRGEAAKHAAFVLEAGVKPSEPPPPSVEPTPVRTRGRAAAAAAAAAVAEMPAPLPPPTEETSGSNVSGIQQSIDEGLILPPGTRRGRRIATDKADKTPPRKKQKLSKIDTAPTEVETTVDDITKTATSASTSVSFSPRLTRSQRPRVAVDLPPVSKIEPEPEPKLDLSSELSELSDLSEVEGNDEEEEEELSPEDEVVKHLGLKAGHLLEQGTLVWARMESYPAWPAVVRNQDDPAVPSAVMASRKQAERKGILPLHLVQFYDKHNSWQWLEPPRLHLLGEDEEFDAGMVTGKNTLQRFKNQHLRAECRAAYRRAKADMLASDDVSMDNHSNEEGEGSASEKITEDNKSTPIVQAKEERPSEPPLIPDWPIVEPVTEPTFASYDLLPINLPPPQPLSEHGLNPYAPPRPQQMVYNPQVPQYPPAYQQRYEHTSLYQSPNHTPYTAYPQYSYQYPPYQIPPHEPQSQPQPLPSSHFPIHPSHHPPPQGPQPLLSPHPLHLSHAPPPPLPVHQQSPQHSPMPHRSPQALVVPQQSSQQQPIPQRSPQPISMPQRSPQPMPVPQSMPMPQRSPQPPVTAHRSPQPLPAPQRSPQLLPVPQHSSQPPSLPPQRSPQPIVSRYLRSSDPVPPVPPAPQPSVHIPIFDMPSSSYNMRPRPQLWRPPAEPPPTSYTFVYEQYNEFGKGKTDQDD